MKLNGAPTLTKRQIASRENGAKSKGPITPEGKERSSKNALKHGLCASRLCLIPRDDPEELAQARKAAYDEHKPVGITEEQIVERIVTLNWRLSRIPEMEADYIGYHKFYEEKFDQVFEESNELKQLNNLARYESSLERSLQRSLKMLYDLKKAKRTQEAEQGPSAEEYPDVSPEFKQEYADIHEQKIKFLIELFERSVRLRPALDGTYPGFGGKSPEEYLATLDGDGDDPYDWHLKSIYRKIKEAERTRAA